MNEEKYMSYSIFDEMYPRFKIAKPIRLIELFAGIGAQAKALERLGVPFKHWKVVEFDKHAVASYNAVHGTDFAPADIREIHAKNLEIVERESYTYILTYSFPCQDLSLAGHRRGMKKGTGTRSGLLWEVERILDECGEDLPHVLLMENVPQVIGKKNINDFQAWETKLESLGYQNYIEVLNAKNYGIPQNRERCFMVSILGEYSYTFPKKRELKKKLKDMLEENVPSQYWLTDKQIQSIVHSTYESTRSSISDEYDTHTHTLTARDYKGAKCVRIKEKTSKGFAEAKGGGRSIYKPSSSKERSSTARNDSNIKNKP